MTDTTLPPAGWYSDPAGSPNRRWWDGQAWTQHTEQLPPPVQAPPAFGAPQQQAFPAIQQPMVGPGFVGGPYRPAYDAARGKNSAAVVSLVAGIGSIVLLFPPMNRVTVFSAIGAIVWGIIALRRASWSGVGRKRAIWGVVLGSVGFVFSILALVTLVGPAAPPYDRAYVEKTIVDGIAKQSSGQLVTVQCPTDPPFTVGSTFQCVATTADGTNHFIDVKVQDDTGSFTWQAKG